MPEEADKRRGRPKRPAIEAVRTVWWYWSVRDASGLSESKLEAQFDKVDRKALNKHRSTRWNKYKFGRSSPSPELVESVDSVLKGSRGVYDHDLWLLAASTELQPGQLRQIAERLPRDFRDLVVADDVPAECEFWMRQGVDLIAATIEASEPGRPKAPAGTTACFLLLLARLSVLIQDEDLHFHAYRGIARLTAWRAKEHLRPVLAMLVAVLIRDWSGTQYRSPISRDVMNDLKKIRSGPLPPWVAEQMSLPLAKRESTAGPFDPSLARYFWMAEKLAT